MIKVAVDFTDFPQLLAEIVKQTLVDAIDMEMLEIKNTEDFERINKQTDVLLVSTGDREKEVTLADLKNRSNATVVALHTGGFIAHLYSVQVDPLYDPSPNSILAEIRKVAAENPHNNNRVGSNG